MVDLLASVSHDLRTPLTSIMLRADLLERGLPDSNPTVIRQHSRYIQEACQHMLFLVDQFQSYFRLEAGRETADENVVDLAELCREVERFIRPMAERKGLGFRVSAPQGPLLTFTDGGKVRQILLNLLSNAVKFTSAGDVGLSLVVHMNEAIFEVHDTGGGISAEDRGKIFQPFWRGSHAVSGGAVAASGSGLGLFLASRLAQILGGDVKVWSQVGEGSTFTVRLPLNVSGRWES